MSRKKLSIHDVLNEDRTQVNTQVNTSSHNETEDPPQAETSTPIRASSTKKTRKSRGRPPKKNAQADSNLDTLFKSKESKADYVRLSVTLPPDLFDRLQMVSIKRRRQKESYTFCHLVREAIQEWIDQAEEE